MKSKRIKKKKVKSTLMHEGLLFEQCEREKAWV